MKFSLPLVLALFVNNLGLMPALGANVWTGAGSDNSWSNTDNWSLGFVPISNTIHPVSGPWDDPSGALYPLTPETEDDGPVGNNDVLFNQNGVHAVIDAATHARTFGINLGYHGTSNSIDIVGGVLDSGNESAFWGINIGRGWSSNGDPDGTEINPDPVARLTITSGATANVDAFYVPYTRSRPGYNGDPSTEPGMHGELLISGSTVNTYYMSVGQFTSTGLVELSGNSVLNVQYNIDFNSNGAANEPRISDQLGHLDVSDTSVIRMGLDPFFQGILTDPVQYQSVFLDMYQALVDAGNITANNGTATPILSLETDGTLYWFQIAAPSVVIPGDFDGDSDVDGRDFLIWQRGESPNSLSAEDLADWQNNYGVGGLQAITSIAIPEPTTMAFVLTGLGSLLVTRRRASIC